MDTPRENQLEKELTALLGVVEPAATATATEPEPVQCLTWAEGSAVAGVIGTVTCRTWPVEPDSEDSYTVLDAEDGVVAVTVVWRPGAREVEVSVLGTDEGAVQGAWETEMEEAVKRTLL